MRRGEIVSVSFDPVRGSEAAKTRPAVVVSNDAANATATRLGRGVITVVPVTSNISRIYPFQVFLSAGQTGLQHDSKAQAEQIRSVAVELVGGRLGQLPAELISELDRALRVHLSLLRRSAHRLGLEAFSAAGWQGAVGRVGAVPDATLRPEPFTPQASAEVLEDLRTRLRATRWPDAPEDAGWSLGTDVAYLRELVAYWAEEFDWPAQEAALARLPRFRVRLGGLGIHFAHVRAAAPAGPVLPLILSHGWPDSFWRYSKVIPLLTDPGAHGGDPADAFDVVVPDMPGYGYSDRPAGAPLDSIAVAGLWAELMGVLGYARFGAAGGDIGSGVSRYLGLDHPDRVVAVHRIDAGAPVFTGDPADLTPGERAWIDRVAAWGAAEGAYSAMHRTKPQTAAMGLTDSPAGLAAWIVEKLRAWSDCDGDVERRFSKDEILTNVTIYWLTGTIGSSMRMYHANGAIPPAQHARRVEVPSGFSLFPADISHPPRAWLERTTNVVRVTEPPRGGHFAPFEEPELYAQELRAFFRPYRTATTG